MVQTNGDKKSCDNDNESCTSKCKIVEELINCMGKWLLYIENSPYIHYNLNKGSYIENIFMDTIEDRHEYEIDEGECKHASSIGKSEGNSRRKKVLIRSLTLFLPSIHTRMISNTDK